eukprot:scaffold9910_cov87-Skeletonema_dohrnii-CCMP3373.AAC.1
MSGRWVRVSTHTTKSTGRYPLGIPTPGTYPIFRVFSSGYGDGYKTLISTSNNGSLREVAPGGTVGTPKSRRLGERGGLVRKPPATNKIPIHHSLTTNVGT